MKILHTSDWHLGRSLFGKKRYDEFNDFLNWLSTTIEKESIDALLVSGDVFDTSTPSNRAQELYYQFLCKISGSCCHHVVVIAGNHDSPSFLNAPKELLRALNVYVVGAATRNPEDEVIALYDTQHNPEAIVCAVPYLRDKDIRTVEAGETIDDKNDKLVAGLKNHYAVVCSIAEKKQSTFKRDGHPEVPIIGMGHLFTTGGKTIDGDGVRELYVGSLAHVGERVFPASIDYLALGHLHVSQYVGESEQIRYSGSPIPMGFGEAAQNKKVIIISFSDKTPIIKELQIPCFQPLERIAGSLDDIQTQIEQLKHNESTAWLEIEYTGSNVQGNLRERFNEAVADSPMEILRIRNKHIIDRVITTLHDNETLEDLGVNNVFERCLETFDVPPDDRPELMRSYNEILDFLHEEDTNAE